MPWSSKQRHKLIGKRLTAKSPNRCKTHFFESTYRRVIKCDSPYFLLDFSTPIPAAWPPKCTPAIPDTKDSFQFLKRLLCYAHVLKSYSRLKCSFIQLNLLFFLYIYPLRFPICLCFYQGTERETWDNMVATVLQLQCHYICL